MVKLSSKIMTGLLNILQAQKMFLQAQLRRTVAPWQALVGATGYAPS